MERFCLWLNRIEILAGILICLFFGALFYVCAYDKDLIARVDAEIAAKEKAEATVKADADFPRVERAQWKVTVHSCWDTDWEAFYFLMSKSMDERVQLPSLPANVQIGSMVKLRKISGARDPWHISSYTIVPVAHQLGQKVSS